VKDNRLSSLDASFLEVESETAHMHVGWSALFAPPRSRPRPSFEELRAHVESRLSLAPRYRQKLAPVPLGVHHPVWVDDPEFDIERHVLRAASSDWSELVDTVMSAQLDRARPMWELWVADGLADGRIGIVGKTHHCMVDGLAAVGLAALLLDATPEPPTRESDDWQPQCPPGHLSLLAEGLLDIAGGGLHLASLPLRLASHPKRLVGLARESSRTARAVVRSLEPAAPATAFNAPISGDRHLARARRPLGDLNRIRRRFGATVNDVVLAVAAGGVRRLLERYGEAPIGLKTMVPVSVRGENGGGELGNQLSFVFIDLPCDEANPVRRLQHVKLAMTECKRRGEPEGGDAVLRAFGYAPLALQHLVSRLVASPRAFNLVVSNIPGPREPLYMLGCELEEAYPVVPIADRHAVAIGVTTIKDESFFGVYADRASLPDADLLADGISDSLEELLALS
jgi:diacylglycerol O-acyltransferase / wax synthase